MDNFLSLIDGESQEVDTIINAVKNPQKGEARRLLMFINSIVDHYLARPKENKACYPIVCIPNSPSWARKVVLEFLIIKMSLFYNSKKRNDFYKRIKEVIVLKEDEGKKGRYEQEFRKYIRPILKQIPQKNVGEEENYKNLIFCSDADIKVSKKEKNPYINEFFGPYDDVCYNSNLTICKNITSRDIRMQIDDSDEPPIIDNIFVFYTNNDNCNSLADSATSGIGNGIKNCFLFDFIEGPFRLYSIRKKKFSFGKRFPMLDGNERDVLRYKHFITLTEEESRIMYNIEQESQHIYIPNGPFYIGQISKLIDDSDYPWRNRIHFSLCLDEGQAKEYMKNLNENYTNLAQENFQESITHQLEIAKDNILPIITAFVGNASSIAIILPYDSTQQEKSLFERILPKSKKINFYNYSDLKKAKDKIKESHIINFYYKSHYTNGRYPQYPNSFDPYILNVGQKILDITNGYIFENIYLWDRYNYDEILYHLLISEFRRIHSILPERPTKPEIDTIERETIDDEERNSSRTIKSYKVRFKDGSSISIPETELVVVHNGIEKYICRMDELVDSMSTNISLQKLDDLESILEEFMQKKTKEANENERAIRNYYYKQGKISIQERDSKHMLWKILLSHKVDTLGAKTVYFEIMSVLKDSDRILEKSFESWYIIDSSMMLPIKKVCQERLIEYLGLNNTKYLSIARTQKRITRNNTRELNTMKDEFMLNMLFQEINSDKYEEFEDSKLNTEILHLENISALQALVGMIEEGVNIKYVQSIK